MELKFVDRPSAVSAAAPTASPEPLDEPPAETLARDVKAVAIKMRYVLLLLPRHKQEATDELKHWDLWGPLVICLCLSVSLALVSYQDNLENFINVFLIFWVGGFVIALNSKLLGSKAYASADVGPCSSR